MENVFLVTGRLNAHMPVFQMVNPLEMKNFIQSFVFNQPTNISNEKRFLQDLFSNSEAPASELLKNQQEMFPRHYMDIVTSKFTSSTIHCCAILRQMVNVPSWSTNKTFQDIFMLLLLKELKLVLNINNTTHLT